MEFEGVVHKILPLQQGTSARGEWQKQDVIFELPSEYSRKICVTFFNKPSDVAKLSEGATFTVSVNVESREYNGRWYTDVRAWRVQPAGSGGGAGSGMGAGTAMPTTPSGSIGSPAAPFPAAPLEESGYASSGPAEVDDLPF